MSVLEAARVWGTLFLLFLDLPIKPSTRTFWKCEVSFPLCGRSLFLVSTWEVPYLLSASAVFVIIPNMLQNLQNLQSEQQLRSGKDLGDSIILKCSGLTTC